MSRPELLPIVTTVVAMSTAGTLILPGGRYVATNMPLRMLIGQTYRFPNLRLVGGPDWIETTHFDINAKAAGELSGARPSSGSSWPDGALASLVPPRRDIGADRITVLEGCNVDGDRRCRR